MLLFDKIERLKWLVAHDPCRVGDRAPFGAVPAGTQVHLKLRVSDEAFSILEGVDLLVSKRKGIWDLNPAIRCEGGFEGHLCLADYPHIVYYAFCLYLGDGDIAYYVPRADARSTAGELVVCGFDGSWTDAGWASSPERCGLRQDGNWGLGDVPPGFQLTVFNPQFATPDWLSGAIMYQIFPDRFARGAQGVLEDGIAYHEAMQRPVRLHENWNEPVDWQGSAKQAYDPIDFFGGTLEGIREKLPYLASLGVEVLYLNPVFEARSNHRYDTADYERIDPLLGDEQSFKELASEARKQGISLILDAVLSHTGDDSRYFNVQDTYGAPGALQGPLSPFHAWYDFSLQADGSPYRSWWGFLSLPEVNERDSSWQRYVFGDLAEAGSQNREETKDFAGVLPAWIAAGARGYRIDVADEIPDDVLSQLRTSVKGADSKAAIIGEVWEDATTKESYGVARDYALGNSLDTVMNYPLRLALIGFALRRIDAYQLATFFKSQQANYPDAFYSCLMNLLSSHDVERIRTVLSLEGPIKHLARSEQLEAVRAITPAQDDHGARLQRMIAALAYALPGTPCIYYGDERGLQGGGDPFCRATMPWDVADVRSRVDCGKDLTAFYQRIGMLRKSSAALRNGAMACFAPDKDTICILRVPLSGGAPLVAVANRSDKACRVVLDALSHSSTLPSEAKCVIAPINGDLEVVFSDEGTHCAKAFGTCRSGLFDIAVSGRTVVFLQPCTTACKS